MDTNAKGAFLMSKYALPYLFKKLLVVLATSVPESPATRASVVGRLPLGLVLLWPIEHAAQGIVL
jgi:hypothetical protein